MEIATLPQGPVPAMMDTLEMFAQSVFAHMRQTISALKAWNAMAKGSATENLAHADAMIRGTGDLRVRNVSLVQKRAQLTLYCIFQFDVQVLLHFWILPIVLMGTNQIMVTLQHMLHTLGHLSIGQVSKRLLYVCSVSVVLIMLTFGLDPADECGGSSRGDCNAVNGKCTCKAGFYGRSCDQVGVGDGTVHRRLDFTFNNDGPEPREQFESPEQKATNYLHQQNLYWSTN